MNYKIINDSMLNMLSHIEENSIDCVITDPPYHLTSITKRFGKEDSKEAQFGKDGSFKRLSKGFMGKSWDGGDISFNPETWEKCFKALKPGGYLLAFGGSRTFHRIACAIEDAGFELRDTILYLYGCGFPKSLNIGLAIDKKMGVKGEKYIDENFLKRNPNKLHYDESINNGFKDGLDSAVRYKVTNQWQGWGSQLKPAYEPIIVARKPIKTTVAENVMIYGVGGINIDECRVGTSESDKYDIRHYTNEDCFINNKPKVSKFQVKPKNELGRFPANIIHDGSEEVVSLFPYTESGKMTSEHQRHTDGSPNGIYGKFDKEHPLSETYGDSGSASRFFYTAKASKKDRDEGLGGFKQKQTTRKNIHPTVKPCELMQYLVRLVAPKGATILDPFMGSGSTGKAVMFENRERDADYKFIGIDLEKEYCVIAEMRIDYALNKYEYDFKQELQESKEKGQLNIFDMEENI